MGVRNAMYDQTRNGCPEVPGAGTTEVHTRTLAFGLVVSGVAVLLLAARKASADSTLPRWRRDMRECARTHVKAGTLYQWGGGRDPRTTGRGLLRSDHRLRAQNGL